MATAAAQQPQHRVLITGANRGLGAELVRQYANEGWEVIACCRPSEGCEELKEFKANPHVQLKELDVCDESAIHKLVTDLKGCPLDVLINNAGIRPCGKFGQMDYKAWAETFAINAMAPFRMTEALLECLQASNLKTVVLLTSTMGSLTEASGGCFEYRSAEAALNMVGKCLAMELKPKGIKVMLVHPGTVRTAMEKAPEAPDNLNTSIAGVRKVICNANMENSGKFLDWTGKEMAW